MSKLFGGFTRYNSIGGWVDNDKLYYDKNGVVYEIMMTKLEGDKLNKIVNMIKKLYNQKSIMITIEQLKYNFL